MTIVTDSKRPQGKAHQSHSSGAGSGGNRSLTGGLNVLEGGSYRIHVQNKVWGMVLASAHSLEFLTIFATLYACVCCCVCVFLCCCVSLIAEYKSMVRTAGPPCYGDNAPDDR
jgi:hypothetical protein